MTEIKTDQSVTGASAPAPDPSQAGSGGWLAFATVAWLLIILASLRGSLGSGSDLALAVAATALLQLVLASILVGAAVGRWASGQLAVHASRSTSGVRDQAAPIIAGFCAGALASGPILLAQGIPGKAAAAIALLLSLAGAIGGAFALLRPAALVSAAVAATLAANVFFNLVAVFADDLLRLFGADGTVAGQDAANGYLRLSQALIAGVLAGLVGFGKLRRDSRHSAVTVRWPHYLFAGGSAGLLWIVSDLFSRLGAGRLLAMASNDATGDRLIHASLGDSRVVTGMLLFFVGAITAIVAFGRTIPPSRRS